MSRTTTILALLQTIIVVLGFFAVATTLKMLGYPESAAVNWNPLAVLLREHGAWLLLLPPLWVLWATAARHQDRGFLSERAVFIAGVCSCGIIIGLFLYAAAFAFSRPMWIHVR
ncbi:MAG TPA: hypothetical protein VF614_15330 [Chthoniobacteraceae bacterium]|jgi:uncharacterized protein YacL